MGEDVPLTLVYRHHPTGLEFGRDQFWDDLESLALHCTSLCVSVVGTCLHVSTPVLTGVEATLQRLGLGARQFDVRNFNSCFPGTFAQQKTSNLVLPSMYA